MYKRINKGMRALIRYVKDMREVYASCQCKRCKRILARAKCLADLVRTVPKEKCQ